VHVLAHNRDRPSEVTLQRRVLPRQLGNQETLSLGLRAVFGEYGPGAAALTG
jgi:hypothetical protein